MKSECNEELAKLIGSGSSVRSLNFIRHRWENRKIEPEDRHPGPTHQRVLQ
jgi:hypothetical protein